MSETAFRIVYQKWSVERLAWTVTRRKAEYRPEAITAMLQELGRRGVADDQIAIIAASAGGSETSPSTSAVFDGQGAHFLFPRRLGRPQYFLRWIAWAVIFLGVAFGLEGLLPRLEPWSALIWVGLALIYRIAWIDIPRLRDAGYSPFLLIGLLVPIVNLVIVLMLFLVPTEMREPTEGVMG